MTVQQEQESNKTSEGIRVFVYGTLKRFHPNHYLLEDKGITDTVYLGRCFVTGPYQMLSFGYHPGVQRTSDPIVKNKLYGEVYRIGKDTLRALDILEGNGHFFTRTQIQTPWKKAWIYLVPEAYSGRPLVSNPMAWFPTDAEKAFIESGAEFQAEDIPAALAAVS